jgi:sterol desaturase/sphingolipid hydroxylase (fatty acid hydroxylase superfamily)
VINGPEMHRWHHSTDLEPPGMNFSTKLAIWDWLFGTAWLPRAARPTQYGLTYVEFPKGYLRQNLFAFRRFKPADNEPAEAAESVSQASG